MGGLVLWGGLLPDDVRARYEENFRASAEYQEARDHWKTVLAEMPAYRVGSADAEVEAGQTGDFGLHCNAPNSMIAWL